MKILLICILTLANSFYFGPSLNESLHYEIIEKNALQIKIIKTEAGFDALDISFDINSDLETFIEVINDVGSYQDWVYRCLSSQEMAASTPGSIGYTNTFDFPFPFMDRKLSVECKQHIHDGIFYSWSKPAKNQSVVEDFVNIDHFESMWKVSPKDSGGLLIEYYVSSTPGGAIPAFLYNLAVKEGPRKTILNLIQVVESRSSDNQ